MHVHVLRTFTCVSAASAASPAPTHPSIKEAALRAASTLYVRRLIPMGIMDSPSEYGSNMVQIWSEYGRNMVRKCPNMSHMSKYV